MTRLTMIDPAAESAGKPILDAVNRKLGMVPNMMCVLAVNPTILNAYLTFSDAVTRSGLGTKVHEQIALAVAKRLVVFAQRQGGQSQFSPYLTAPADETSPVAKVQAHVMERIRESFTVKQLADVAGMSARNFARVFVQETGVTPHEFVERARVDAARKLLESSGAALKAIAYDCGFGTADRMRIVFTKRIGATPMPRSLSLRPPLSPPRDV